LVNFHDMVPLFDLGYVYMFVEEEAGFGSERGPIVGYYFVDCYAKLAVGKEKSQRSGEGVKIVGEDQEDVV
jgi:hypothetical protein